ncbi:hypothetical protein EER27_03585 [Lysobacter psychrotolerans]|uniref:Uncharacterized protein n=2 Tax=Montanilutibacter psychrotolerans TaxID=1327343 RepID=A0A3M8SYK6_9GAMM|nr:hypothetical protein EER27_03585 [Lysobacter psychrotolerans]
MSARLIFLPPTYAILIAIVPAVLLAGCRTMGEPMKVELPPAEIVLPPLTTRGEFLIEADKLDTWNAVGQIAVRTAGVEYDGRAQMLDLYSLRYRGEAFLILTKALPQSETIRRLTTRVTATTQAGKPIDSDAVAELLALLQRQLPAEIAVVRATQAAERTKAEK